ncbi:tRNA1(Val) (adenine(37)-N6)-methyltransferase [Geminicoccus flavidas]|uniref:tRNA1(Val) (adenine(37)-N6)-methyltransferase n=1 Tax=Geminicoccus flavidas TaxID=2506407 RepID=UPI0013588CA8|nr:methyltransferase [Geminicoccus flavidas]
MTARFGLLQGRVAMIDQPELPRPAIDGVLLAAAAPVPGPQRVLDAGSGTGVVGLCLLARATDLQVTALDVNETALAAASANAALNGRQGSFTAVAADLAGFRDRGFDLVLSNPPFHHPASSRAHEPARDLARFGGMALSDWLGHCLRLCRSRGEVVVILRADRMAPALGSLAGKAGGIRILPVHPRAEQPASRVLIRARKGDRSPDMLLPGLVLHGQDGRWTQAARHILEDGGAIDWAAGDRESGSAR